MNQGVSKAMHPLKAVGNNLFHVSFLFSSGVQSSIFTRFPYMSSYCLPFVYICFCHFYKDTAHKIQAYSCFIVLHFIGTLQILHFLQIGFIVIVPFLLSHWDFSFVFGYGLSFLVGSSVFLLMVVQQLWFWCSHKRLWVCVFYPAILNRSLFHKLNVAGSPVLSMSVGTVFSKKRLLALCLCVTFW